MGTMRRVIAIILCGLIVTMAWAGHSPVSPTSAANKVPVAGSDGKIAEGYLPALSQSVGGTGTTTGAGAGALMWTEKTASFTTANENNYLCLNGAGAGITMTLHSSPADADEVVVMRSGLGAVLIAANTINGTAFKLGAVRRGAIARFVYDSGTSSWWTLDEDVGFIASTNLTAFVTAQTGVTTTGGAVSTWADQSGNAYDFTQGTGSAQPVHSTTSLTNHPGITFDGGDYVDASDGAQWNYTDMTYVGVVKITSTTSANIWNHLASSVGQNLAHGSVTSRKLASANNATTYSDTGRLLNSEPTVVSLVHRTGTFAGNMFRVHSFWSSEVSQGTIGDLAGPMRIGANQAGAGAYTGIMGMSAWWSSDIGEELLKYAERFGMFSACD